LGFRLGDQALQFDPVRISRWERCRNRPHVGERQLPVAFRRIEQCKKGTILLGNTPGPLGPSRTGHQSKETKRHGQHDQWWKYVTSWSAHILP